MITESDFITFLHRQLNEKDDLLLKLCRSESSKSERLVEVSKLINKHSEEISDFKNKIDSQNINNASLEVEK